MKTRIFALLLCGIVSVAMIGCGGKSDTDSSSSGTTTPAATTPATGTTTSDNPAKKDAAAPSSGGGATIGINPNFNGPADGGVGSKATK